MSTPTPVSALPSPPRDNIPVLSYGSRGTGRRAARMVYVVAVGVVAGVVWSAAFNRYIVGHGHPPARQTSLVTMVQSMRSQVALFKLQHNDRLPGVCPLVRSGGPPDADAATFWAQMTQFTDLDGHTNPTKTEAFCFGPYFYGAYFQSAPANPMNGSNTIASKPARGVGFVYDFAGGAGSGKIWGVDEAGILVIQ